MRRPEKGERVKWSDEVRLIDELLKRVTNLGAVVERDITQLESRKTTLENAIENLESDYELLRARNENANKEFKKSIQMDLQNLEESKRRVQQREKLLIEKEKEIGRLKAELENHVADAQATRRQMESVGRNHARK